MKSSWILRADKKRKRVTVWSPAKINLFLIIQGRLPSGYHKLRSLMVPVTLADQVTLEKDPKIKDDHVECNVTDIPTDNRNLAIKAVRALSDFGIRTDPVRIRISKNIPAGAGLGGGSSNAAAVLKGLDWLYSLRLSNYKLRIIGQQVGADVPFFFKERACIATGIGEILRPSHVAPEIWFIIGFPGISIPTSKVYDSLSTELTNPNARVRMPSSLTGGGKQVKTGGKSAWRLFNDLEKVVFPQYPSLKAFKIKLLATGAVEARMSGSGSSIFGIFESGTAASMALSRLRNNSQGWRLFLARPIWQGTVERWRDVNGRNGSESLSR